MYVFFLIDVEYLFNMLSGIKITIEKRDVFFPFSPPRRHLTDHFKADLEDLF